MLPFWHFFFRESLYRGSEKLVGKWFFFCLDGRQVCLVLSGSGFLGLVVGPISHLGCIIVLGLIEN